MNQKRIGYAILGLLILGSAGVLGKWYVDACGEDIGTCATNKWNNPNFNIINVASYNYTDYDIFGVTDHSVYNDPSNKHDAYTIQHSMPGTAWCEGEIAVTREPLKNLPSDLILHFYPDGRVAGDIEYDIQPAPHRTYQSATSSLYLRDELASRRSPTRSSVMQRCASDQGHAKSASDYAIFSRRAGQLAEAAMGLDPKDRPRSVGMISKSLAST